MAPNRRFALTVSSVLALSLWSSSAAAKGLTIRQQKTVGSYRLQLVIGLAEPMSMKPGKGERMLAGKAANCQMPMSGMSMGGNLCNHHVEVHILQAKSGAVVTNAVVSIVLHNTTTHKTITVPVSEMQGSSGAKDIHYGNNIHAAAGTYVVEVHVNRTAASFTVTLV